MHVINSNALTVENTSTGFPNLATRSDLEKVVSTVYGYALSDSVLKNGEFSGQPFGALRVLP